ncbi:MAG: KpsF/GutQ family sugar-phosphate isomerase [Terrimicrobiaceae bacterium]|nr:KpsF/GutQ family sugar-phosphate isomerase [Terrimicrobiaceae bacterium]
MSHDPLVQRARQIIGIEIEEARAAAERLDGSFARAVGILQQTIEQRGKIVVLGVGKSGCIGEKIAATLTSTGAPAVVLHPLNALHGDLGVVCDGDAVLALSYSGETEELLNILAALTRFDVRLIAITGNTSSTLARSAEAVLDARVSREACPLNLAPTSSTTAMLVLGDALAMVLLEARGFDKDAFAKFHPAGRLGRNLLLRVRDIVRPASQLALVAPDTPVLEALREMTRHRSGAAVVRGSGGELAGIFTHGDFARGFAGAPDIATRPVREFMTSHPVTIGEERLAAEVLQVLQHHRIDDLIVLDAAGHPVGLVDSQDLSRLKLV